MVEVREIPLAQIHRPLPRVNDSNKVEALMESIAKEGLREPIDVLEVEGKYYGFSGCHRYEAILGKIPSNCRPTALFMYRKDVVSFAKTEAKKLTETVLITHHV
ncbi:MAG: ParB N-terminal domain-containing protein, partial [Symploca sp. SIO3E6]|nr:ParB N-terminal domain-containing protein [Caldora sp. SIO3E6]